MKKPLPVARVHVTELVRGDPQQYRPAFLLPMPEIGDVRCHHGFFFFAALEEINGQRGSITLFVGRPPCPCGCGAPGDAFMVCPPPEEARALGKQLLSLADEQEAAAAAAAKAAIDKAAGA